jgi:hypothetical protein
MMVKSGRKGVAEMPEERTKYYVNEATGDIHTEFELLLMLNFFGVLDLEGKTFDEYIKEKVEDGTYTVCY